MAVLTGLRRFTNYSIQVLAFTRVGDGITTKPIICTTEEDGTDRITVMLITTAAVHCRSESDSFEMLSYKSRGFKYSILMNWQTHFSLGLCNSYTAVTSSVFRYVFDTTYNINLCSLPYITTCFDLCCCYKLYIYVCMWLHSLSILQCNYVFCCLQSIVYYLVSRSNMQSINVRL